MISNKERSFIERAADEAANSPCLMRHGCVAVMNGRIVGKGYNNYRCRSRDGFINNTMTCHAEIAALRQAYKCIKNFKKIILYVVRLDSHDLLQESTPCVNCMKIINKLRIKRVVHSTNGGSIVVRQPRSYENKHVTRGQRTLLDILVA